MQTKLCIRGLPLFSCGVSARGVFALGVVARGVVAVGQLSCGVIAIGQLSLGFITVSQLGLGFVSINQVGLAMFILAQAGIGIIAAFGFAVIGFISNNAGNYKIDFTAVTAEASSFTEAEVQCWNSLMYDTMPLVIWSASWCLLLLFAFLKLRHHLEKKGIIPSNRI